MTNRGDVLDFWAQRFGSRPGVLPWGPLRVRFHSLPHGDRYARCRTDRQTILQRHNDVLSHVLGDGCPYVMLASDDDVVVDPHGPRIEPVALEPLIYLPVERLEETSRDDPYFTLQWAPLVWAPGSMDVTLLAIADEHLQSRLFMSLERGVVVKPYDGGIDVIVRDEGEADALAARFESWLPDNDGVFTLDRLIPETRHEEREAMAVLVAAKASPDLDDDGSISMLLIAAGATSDALLATIGSLGAITSLRAVCLGKGDHPSTTATDAGLAHLHQLTTLRRLILAPFPAMTEAAIATLRAALPDCVIEIEDMW